MPKALRTDKSQPVTSIEVSAPRTKGRRRFARSDKERILRGADACLHGELGGFLRREGVYHSQLSDWRAELTRAGAAGLAPKRPGPVAKMDAKDRTIQALNMKLGKLERALAIVNGLVELQKKVQSMFSSLQNNEPLCTR
jgi:transposase